MKQDAYCSRRFLFSKSSTTSSSYHQSQHHSTMLLLLHIRFVWHRISLFLSSVCNTPCTMMVSRIYLLSTKGLVISRVLSSSSPISIPPQSGASLRDRCARDYELLKTNVCLLFSGTPCSMKNLTQINTQ